jgi:hypothetical protein
MKKDRDLEANKERYIHTEIFIFIVIFCSAILIRMPTWWNSAIDVDEGMFALMGREVSRGNLPYTTLFDIKPIGLWVIFAASQIISDSSLVSIRFMGSSFVAITAFIIYKISIIYTKERKYSIVGPIIYVSFTTQITGLAAHTEIILAPFSVLAVYFMKKLTNNKSTKKINMNFFASGFLFGVSSSVKTVAAVPAAILFFYVMYVRMKNQNDNNSQLVFRTILYTLSGSLFFVLPFLYYYYIGKQDVFWHANIGFKLSYVSISSNFAYRIRNIFRVTVQIWPIFIFIIAFIFSIVFSNSVKCNNRKYDEKFLAIWIFAECIAVIAPWQFFPHYFLLVMPPAAVAASYIAREWTEMFIFDEKRKFPALIVSIYISLIPLVQHFYLPPWTNIKKHDLNMQIAREIKKYVSGNQRVFITTIDPMVYFLGGLDMATPYPFPSHLFGPQQSIVPVDTLNEIRRVMNESADIVVIERASLARFDKKAVMAVEDGLARYRMEGRYMISGRVFEVWVSEGFGRGRE